MKPSDAAKNLRRIAAAIDSSKSPKRELVAADIKKILESIESAPVDPAPKA